MGEPGTIINCLPTGEAYTNKEKSHRIVLILQKIYLNKCYNVALYVRGKRKTHQGWDSVFKKSTRRRTLQHTSATTYASANAIFFKTVIFSSRRPSRIICCVGRRVGRRVGRWCVDSHAIVASVVGSHVACLITLALVCFTPHQRDCHARDDRPTDRVCFSNSPFDHWHNIIQLNWIGSVCSLVFYKGR